MMWKEDANEWDVSLNDYSIMSSDARKEFEVHNGNIMQVDRCLNDYHKMSEPYEMGFEFTNAGPGFSIIEERNGAFEIHLCDGYYTNERYEIRRKVQFSKTLVTQTNERPRTTPAEKGCLFYSFDEILCMYKEKKNLTPEQKLEEAQNVFACGGRGIQIR